MAATAQSPFSKEELLTRLKQGTEAWNQWRKSLSDDPDLDLTGMDLRSINLSGTDLHKCHFTEVNLRSANLQGATLWDTTFKDAELFETNFREADLCGADLSVAKHGLFSTQLAGAVLTGAKLPEALTKLYDNLDTVSQISDSAKKLFLALLAACLYSWLTIATTKDVDLITNRASSPLPIIQTAIPIVGFYVVAPIILLCVYFYFHFYLQKLWEELAQLPAIFPDGKPLHQRADPWLFNDLVRAHLSKLRPGRPFLSKFQHKVSIMLAWWLVPITLLLFWGRYLPRHDLLWSLVLALLLSTSITSALQLYRLCRETLEGHARIPFTWKSLFKRRRTYTGLIRVTAVVALLIIISRSAINGTPDRLVARVMNWMRYSPFANLSDADVSIKPSNWTGKKDDELDLVKGANLPGKDFRYADLRYAFLAKADLLGTDFTGGDLAYADLRQANLAGADLGAAVLDSSHMEGAIFGNTSFYNAALYSARVRYADFRNAMLLTPVAIVSCEDWPMAFYDQDMLKQLGLPPDHNDALEAYQESGSQEPFDSWEQKWRENKAKAAKNKAK